MLPSRSLLATHPKLAHALRRLEQSDLAGPCREPTPPALVRAVEQFNAREFFEQHETLEALWLGTPGEIRHLYEGILLVGVGLHHALVRNNYHGAAVKLDHGCRLLAAFPQTCHGVDIGRLHRDAQRARDHLLRLGPQRLREFESDFVPRIHLVPELRGGH